MVKAFPICLGFVHFAGFPQSGDTRQRAISDCRLRQVIFHAKTQKRIVVLDKNDIFELGKNGSLIQILVRKIRDLDELSGLTTPSVEQTEEIDLPDHLNQLWV
jgi:DNA integrity scanning protein DisA with diadenylate cyclase activity